MKDLLIVGAKGMLGHALAETFHDHHPILYDREEMDIASSALVQKTLAKLRPRVVINAAAYTDVDGCEDHEQQAFLINATGVANLAQACKTIGATMVHYSTDYVFAGTRPEGYAEAHEPSPVNAYGRTKLAGERMLEDAGIPFLLIRTSWLFGPSGKNFVATILEKARSLPELTVVDDQIGIPTYTRDLARHTLLLLEQGANGIHHASNGERTSWYDFARAIVAQASIPCAILPMSSKELHRKAKRPAFSVLLNTKDAPLRPWQEALAEYVEILAKGEGRQ